MEIKTDTAPIVKSGLVKNSFWGLVSTVLQTVFLSIFFVIISRHYSTINFANYLIATTVYQFILGISTMGLGTWFIREFEHEAEDKNGLLSRFIKIQIGLGVVFYLLNILLVFLLYSNLEIRLLGLVLGFNIIFDNIIYALSSLNIVQFKQKKTAIVMAIDAFVRLAIVSLLFVWPFSILTLSIFLVLIRLLTMNIFIRIGTTEILSLRYLLRYKISFFDIKNQVLSNWRFLMIVGLPIILWRSATIIISKFLTLDDVANYEISYKIFSVLIIIPIITSSTIFPQFVKFHAKKDNLSILNLYRIISFGFIIFSLISYAFIISYGDFIIPFIFGGKYNLAVISLKEMCLTILVFPNVILQANLIVAMKFEKFDMYFNLAALGVFFVGCFWGFRFFSTLSVVTYSILIAFISFHIIQNIFLIKLKLNSARNALLFYGTLTIFVFAYNYGINFINSRIIFFSFLFSIFVFTTIYILKHKRIFVSQIASMPSKSKTA